MIKSIKELISQTTLEEKASLCSGENFWKTKAVERLGIPSIIMTDGPHGLRKGKNIDDAFGDEGSVPSTCFPAAVTLACSWDRELVQKVGIALGEECQAEDVSIILGPGANIKRSPLCGRNFEYFSEDPYLSTEMAKSHIIGVQSQGVGTSLKHFAGNNQETRRFSINAEIDERTLREIYLASFEGAVQAQPWTVMCAYNRLNGVYCSENKNLLHDILKEEWGFEGLVVSDWGAVNERPLGISAGLDLEMPGTDGSGDRRIVKAVQDGLIDEADLDKAVERILKVVFKALDNKKIDASYDKAAHHLTARITARECMVLLKNEEGILPLKKNGKYALIGAFLKHPRYQGAGSSYINPCILDDMVEEIRKSAGQGASISYSEGFQLENDEDSDALVKAAAATAKSADTAVLCLGLPDRYESEGYDRTHLRIPQNQIALIEEIAKVQSNLVIVLCNGSPVEMPWLPKAKAVLEGYLGGQAMGGAVADLLFGDANPCGKLAETFPVKLSDNPSFLDFPGDGENAEYREGIFVGYRYYDRKEITPLFPFGHGLSYTTFEYTGLSVDKKDMRDSEELTVTVTVKNTGKTAGKEIVQLYVRDVESTLIRPEKELKSFEKVLLQPQEEKNVVFVLDKRAFAYYNVKVKDWCVESGEFEILVGSSSRKIALKESVIVRPVVQIRTMVTRNTVLADIMCYPEGRELVEKFKTATSSPGLGVDMFELLKDSVLRTLLTFKILDDASLDAFIQKINESE